MYTLLFSVKQETQSFLPQEQAPPLLLSGQVAIPEHETVSEEKLSHEAAESGVSLQVFSNSAAKALQSSRVEAP